VTAAGLLLMQALTNLALVPAGAGLPSGWTLARSRGASAPGFRVTADHTLRIDAAAATGVASYRLRAALRPRPGSVSWRWRTSTPLAAASLRRRGRDDAPVRVVLSYADGRMLLYSWGNRESRGEQFPSPAGGRRGVVVLERGEDADGSWHLERRDPFADYQLVFHRAPRALVAAGVGADTGHLRGHASAEVGDLTWESGGAP
jgi:hypothetical protein